MRKPIQHLFLRITVLLLTAVLLLTLAGCSPSLKIEGSPASKDNVTVTLEKATAVKKSDPDRYEYAFSGIIENNSDEGVMKVVYSLSLRDKNGEEFRAFSGVYDGEDTAIPPHSKVEFSLDGARWGAQDVPASVAVGVSSVSTETQLPPVRLPQPGDYLYLALNDEKLANIKEKPPVEFSFYVDQGGYGRTATFRTGPLLDRAVELFCNIRVGEETGEYVTDNYNWIGFVWEDGTESSVSLNLKNLEYSAHNMPHIYALKDLDEFWNYASDYLIEVQ